MSPDSDPFAGEIWEDIAFIIACVDEKRDQQFEGAAGRAYRMVALNINAGKASYELIKMDVHGQATPIDVATSVADLIMASVVLLHEYVPDVREFLELQIKDYRITLEHRE